MNYKQRKNLLKFYNNKVFNYGQKKHMGKNFSRKDFSRTWNQQVTFENCVFEQTIFERARIENCLFLNCSFLNCSFMSCEILDTTFKESDFSRVLFNECTIDSSVFELNSCFESMTYPLEDNKNLINTFSEFSFYSEKQAEDIYMLLNQLKKIPAMRATSSLFHTKKRSPSKSERKEYKKIKPKDAKKMGLTKKERLRENKKRKSYRNQAIQVHKQNTKDGKNTYVKKEHYFF
ncbi:pentapeptide repeat-containing protein [Tetragenococcus muriaticus]|nr:pentapeptide repeat-containing protein [Tetragenococcus muriaticus]